LKQMRLGNDFLPELDRKRTQAAVEEALEKYRICMFLTFEEREASTTAGYNGREHGPTNTTSDQTAQIAIHNVDAQAARKAYVERIERAVKRLPRMEKFLIERRYMAEDSPYITDQRVYSIEFQPPISFPVYRNYRWEAFYKLALYLRIAVIKENSEEEGEDGGAIDHSKDENEQKEQ